MGATPQSWAKAASLRRRCGLSPAATSRAPAVSVPTPRAATGSGAVVATREQETGHGLKRKPQIVEVMKREEPDDGRVPIGRLHREFKHVGAVHWDVISAARMLLKAVEQFARQVLTVHRDAPTRELQGVSPPIPQPTSSTRSSGPSARVWSPSSTCRCTYAVRRGTIRGLVRDSKYASCRQLCCAR